MGRFYTGDTGESTGPHLDFRVYNPETKGYEDPSKFTSYLSTGGNEFNFPVTSGFKPGGRVSPVTGKIKPHPGIDYGTEVNTPIDIKGGRLLSTFNDSTGGGIMSQFLVPTEQGPREFLLLHGSDKNKITGDSAVFDYDPSKIMDMPSMMADTPSMNSNGNQVEAKERAQEYITRNMNAGEVVNSFGNDFDNMESERLGNALQSAQEAIIQKRMDSGESFGMIQALKEEDD